MNKSEDISELAKALCAFQSTMVAVKKDATNPFYKSRYTTLDTIWEAIRKPLSDNGLSVTQTMGVLGVEGSPINAMETMLCHSSGQWISGTIILNPVKNDPQGLGSSISYARRYSLSAILGIVADEDDDAEAATKPPKPTSTAKTKPTPGEADKSANEPLGDSKSQEQSLDEQIPKTKEELFAWLAEAKSWKSTAPATSFLVNKCKITEERIENNPAGVYQEVKDLV